MWTLRDFDIVESLTRKVRLLSLSQLRRIWWPQQGASRVVCRRLQKLVRGGLLEHVTLNVEPLAVATPLTSWHPGEPPADFIAVSRAAKARWSRATTPQTVFVASRLAANLFGSSTGRLPPVDHRDHDLLLGETYAVYRMQHPQIAKWWVGEDCRPKAGFRVKDPDAFLIDGSGTIVRVIESAGRYSSAQCLSFHEHCAQHNLPYELW